MPPVAFEATARLVVERAGNRSAAALALICLTIVLFLACVLLAGSPMGPLLAMAALAAAVVILAQLPMGRQGTILELGVLYALVVSLYGIYPLAVYWLNNYTFLATSDNRLFAAQPPPEEVAAVAWHYVTYLAAFAAAYFLHRGRESAQRIKLQAADSTTVALLLGAFIVVDAMLLSLQWIAGFEQTTYASTYLWYKELPLWVQQLAKHLGWVATALEIAVVTALVTDFKRYRAVLFVWLLAEAFLTAYLGGSRTGLFLLLLAFAIAYHHIVRPWRAKHMLTFGIAGLVLFMVLGAVRTTGGLDGAVVPLTTNAGEFESIFANAFEIDRLVRSGGLHDVPVAAHFGDLLSFVPQQLLPFEKWDFGTWYAVTFHHDYYQSGGGYAFGVIPESMLGLGTVDLVFRGFIVGILFAIAVRAAAQRRTGFWMMVFSVWLTVESYWTFRSGSLSILPMLILGFIPAMVMIRALEMILRTRTRRQPAGPE